jgi:hypothetical protein
LNIRTLTREAIVNAILRKIEGKIVAIDLENEELVIRDGKKDWGIPFCDVSNLLNFENEGKLDLLGEVVVVDNGIMKRLLNGETD